MSGGGRVRGEGVRRWVSHEEVKRGCQEVGES